MHRWTTWAYVFLDSGLFAEPLCPAMTPATTSWRDYMLTEHGVPCRSLTPDASLDGHGDFLLDFLHSGIPEAVTQRNPMVALLQTAVTWRVDQGVRMRRYFPGDGLWGLPTLLSVAAFGDLKPQSVASCARMGATLTPETDVRPEGHRHSKLQRLALAKAATAAGGPAQPLPPAPPATAAYSALASGFMGAPLTEAAATFSQMTVAMTMRIAWASSQSMGARGDPIIALFLATSQQSGFE